MLTLYVNKEGIIMLMLAPMMDTNPVFEMLIHYYSNTAHNMHHVIHLMHTILQHLHPSKPPQQFCIRHRCEVWRVDT